MCDVEMDFTARAEVSSYDRSHDVGFGRPHERKLQEARDMHTGKEA
jgi:hypothetical protein